jgi:hypothetical protein
MVARRNRFEGKDAVMFNAFKGRFEPRFIGVFRQLVICHGARSFEHRFIKRGRMGQQLSADDMSIPADGRVPTLSGRRGVREAVVQ